MSLKKPAFLNIGVSIIFAVAMIFTTYFLDGSEHEQIVIFLRIALWFIPFSLLSSVSVKELKTGCLINKNNFHNLT